MKLTVGLVGTPGTSRANQTGTWRVTLPRFLHAKCSGCRLCVLVCPEGCVTGDVSRKYFDYDPFFCKGCGICAVACPLGDIEMQAEVH